ncbi:uncharacterized protein LOC135491606 [Lineus longissimus]|uniref:uncharacterized protein LOC135491606 n=1 Tax=Lineus longissimus TaxID=88925 RepID=UPI00315D44FF
MEDNFTKWVEATPLRTMETEEVCNAIIKDLVSRFGCMYIIHSDRGAQFVSSLYTALMKKLGVDKTLTTAYNPKTREMKLPLDLLYTTPSEDVTNVPAYVTNLEAKFHKAFALVRNHLNTTQRVQKKQWKTSLPTYQSLKAGDAVYYFNPRKSFKGDRHRPWLGPYLVLEMNEDFTVLLQCDEAGRTMMTHADKLRIARGVNLEWPRPQ